MHSLVPAPRLEVSWVVPRELPPVALDPVTWAGVEWDVEAVALVTLQDLTLYAALHLAPKVDFALDLAHLTTRRASAQDDGFDDALPRVRPGWRGALSDGEAPPPGSPFYRAPEILLRARVPPPDPYLVDLGPLVDAFRAVTTRLARRWRRSPPIPRAIRDHMASAPWVLLHPDVAELARQQASATATGLADLIQAVREAPGIGPGAPASTRLPTPAESLYVGLRARRSTGILRRADVAWIERVRPTFRVAHANAARRRWTAHAARFAIRPVVIPLEPPIQPGLSGTSVARVLERVPLESRRRALCPAALLALRDAPSVDPDLVVDVERWGRPEWARQVHGLLGDALRAHLGSTDPLRELGLR
jgi:hypothetical protein